MTGNLSNTIQASGKLHRNWWIDAALFFSATLAVLSGIYFLFFPSGGYQGGRNPAYGVTLIFSRQVWDVLHTWGGVAMIAVVCIHVIIHFQWILGTIQRSISDLGRRQACKISVRRQLNLFINILVAVTFTLSALSGIYFLFFPHTRNSADPLFLFSRSAWDMLHTWSSILLISAALAHLAIHWKWIVVVTGKILRREPPCNPQQSKAGAVS